MRPNPIWNSIALNNHLHHTHRYQPLKYTWIYLCISFKIDALFPKNDKMSKSDGFVHSRILPLLLSSPSLGPRPNSGRASPGSMTSTATSISCAPVHPWRLTSLHTRRSEPPHRCSPVVRPKFPTLSSKNLTDFTPIFTVKPNNFLYILLWWIRLCKKTKTNKSILDSICCNSFSSSSVQVSLSLTVCALEIVVDYLKKWAVAG